MSASGSTKKYKVAILGANGYAGLELARLLLKHPYAELKGCYSRKPDWKLEDDLPEGRAAGVPTLKWDDLRHEVKEFDTLFLATPPEVSMEVIPLIMKFKIQAIDLSGALRLMPSTFEKAYKMAHLAPEFVNQAHYGLVPWNKSISSLSLISNPGCYATSVLMGILPLLKSQLLDLDSIVIDAKSGTSGAGLKPKENLLFTEVDGDCMPYKVGSHQHLPEIIRYAQEFADAHINPHFCTSLLPARRGIISSIYGTINKELKDLSNEKIIELIDHSFATAYESYPLVKFGRLEQSESKDKMLLSLKRVSGSCRTHISYALINNKIYLFSAIDNLLKGAASQAVENWNQSFQFPIETGLRSSEGDL